MLTATSALLRRAPVANAFMSGEIEDADLRHADAGGLRLAAHGFDQPALGGVARLLDDAHAHHALGDELGHRERDERAGETEDGGEDQQGVEIEPDALLVEDAVDAEQPQA